MSIIQDYSAAFTSEQVFKHEMKIVFSLMKEGKPPQEIRQMVAEQNLFQKRRYRTSAKALGVIFRRAKYLDEKLINIFVTGTRQDTQAILLYSFLMCYRFPREFVLELVRYQYLNNKKTLTKGSIQTFFERKEEESSVVQNWSLTTKEKLRQVMFRIMSECELLMPEKGEWIISPLLISTDLRDYISRNQDHSNFLKLCLNE